MISAIAVWLYAEHGMGFGRIGSKVGEGAPDQTGSSSEPRAPLVKLPGDDAPHQDYMEWWYFNSHLRALDGREFSFHYVFFLVNSAVSYTVGQISLTDHQSGRHYTAQKESAGNPSAGTAQGFNFVLGDWAMTGVDGRDTLRVKTSDFAFDLQTTNSGPVLFHGEGTGLIDMSVAGSSYYYSRPRMNLEGRLTIAGKTLQVTGQSWFDHQWGNFQTSLLGWDWFALQLDDGADIMLYRLRDRTGQPVLYAGTYARGGLTEALRSDDFTADSSGAWRSKVTGVSYPLVWRVRIPRHGIDVQVKPVAQDCEMDARTTTYNTYWEGAIKVSGSHRGRGFLEISPGGARRPAESRR